MRRRQAPAGALPAELMVLVVANFAHFVSAVSVRAAKTSYRFVAPPLRIEPASLGFDPVRGFTREQGKGFLYLHTQNRTKGTNEARLMSLRFIEPMKVKPSGY